VKTLEKPYITFTMRRTGGTSLMTFLSRISSFSNVEHEPFNKERRWGAITETFRISHNRETLRDQIDAALADRPNIKHCIELVPSELTLALLDACLARGYAVFVLQRRSEKDRLRSLFLAMATGAWGPKEAAQIYPEIQSGRRQTKPIDVTRVRHRAMIDAAAMGDLLMGLRNRNADFDWLVFEEVYADRASKVATALSLSHRMGLTLNEDDRHLIEFAAESGQHSENAEALVPEAAKLRDALQDIFG
jgi:hypothetical protein